MRRATAERDFEELVKSLLGEMGIDSIERAAPAPGTNESLRYDFVVKRGDGHKIAIEAKFVGWRRMPRQGVDAVTSHQYAAMQRTGVTSGILFTNAEIADDVRVEWEQAVVPGLQIVDGRTLRALLVDHPDLSKVYDELLASAGTYDSDRGLDDASASTEGTRTLIQSLNTLLGLEPRSRQHSWRPRSYLDDANGLKVELAGIPVGRDAWRQFERWGSRVVRLLFGSHLTSWTEQFEIENGDRRGDLIARVSSNHSTWTAISSHFGARYVVFEFKNYSDPLSQNHVFTTEKYLYRGALRGVAIILARNGWDRSAERAAAGAIRESAKLILCLDMRIISEMLLASSRAEDPSQLLFDHIDAALLNVDR